MLFNLSTTYRSKSNFYEHNLKYIKWLELAGSLMFLIPVWVNFELRYLNLAQLAIIEAAISFTQLILELPTGALADLLGRKKTITFGYLLHATGFLFFWSAKTFNGFLFSSLFFGFGEALISGAKEALVFDTLKQAHQEKTFTKLMNFLQKRFYWGMAIATLIGGLTYQINIHLPLFLNILAILTCAYFASQLREPILDSEKFTLAIYLKQTKQGFSELFKTPKSRRISFYYILLAAVSWPMVISLKNIAMSKVGLTELQIGLILPVMNLLNVYFFHFMLKKQAFKNLPATFIALALVAGLSWLGLAANFSIFMVLIVAFTLSFISSCRWNVIGELTNSCYSSKNRATAISTLSMIIGLSYGSVMILFSIFSNSTINPVILIALFMAGLAGIVLLPLAINLSNNLANKKINFEPQIENPLEKSISLTAK